MLYDKLPAFMSMLTSKQIATLNPLPKVSLAQLATLQVQHHVNVVESYTLKAAETTGSDSLAESLVPEHRYQL